MRFDTNRSGKLDQRELRAALRELGVEKLRSQVHEGYPLKWSEQWQAMVGLCGKQWQVSNGRRLGLVCAFRARLCGTVSVAP